MMKLITALAVCLVAGAASMFAWQWGRSQIEADVYKQRLRERVAAYEELADRYNTAIRRTAVTELLVEDGKLSVIIATADGSRRRIETPFDPSREIYADYVVLDGRLWIRRIFDDATAPGLGEVITPELTEVDWDDPAAIDGRAVYRSLSEGRWVITATGNGALGLAPAPDDTEIDLQPTPEVRDFDQVVQDVEQEMAEVTPGEALRRLFIRR